MEDKLKMFEFSRENPYCLSCSYISKFHGFTSTCMMGEYKNVTISSKSFSVCGDCVKDVKWMLK